MQFTDLFYYLLQIILITPKGFFFQFIIDFMYFYIKNTKITETGKFIIWSGVHKKKTNNVRSLIKGINILSHFPVIIFIFQAINL